MNLVKLNSSLVEFAFECQKELRGDVYYSLQDWSNYLVDNQLFESNEFQIFVGVVDNAPVGILTCNRYSIPRYLGFGIELEEVVIHPEYQQRGYAVSLINKFIESIVSDNDIRKLSVKTDDKIVASRLYQKIFQSIELNVFSKKINLL